MIWVWKDNNNNYNKALKYYFSTDVARNNVVIGEYNNKRYFINKQPLE